MKPHSRRKTVLRSLWVVVLAIVTVGCLAPAGSAPLRGIAWLEISDKVLHFSAYTLLAFLPALHEPRRTTLALAAGLVAWGVLLEFGQLFSPGRSFEVADMAANGVGVCAGLLAGWLLRRWF